MERLFARSPFSLVTIVARIKGALAEGALTAAVEKVQQRHTNLRVRLVDDDRHNPWLTAEWARSIPVEVIPRESAEQWIRVVREAGRVPFDFEQRPPIRCYSSRQGSVVLLSLQHHDRRQTSRRPPDGTMNKANTAAQDSPTQRFVLVYASTRSPANGSATVALHTAARPKIPNPATLDRLPESPAGPTTSPSVPRDVYRAPRGDGFGERTHEPLLRCCVRDGAICGDPRDP